MISPSSSTAASRPRSSGAELDDFDVLIDARLARRAGFGDAFWSIVKV